VVPANDIADGNFTVMKVVSELLLSASSSVPWRYCRRFIAQLWWPSCALLTFASRAELTGLSHVK